ncbi:MAG: tetratricopeptide repeat protein [Elusimicrobia bacterium]|nr:tetratricopeptide repeat protein [Elusimicrobiota bacterium]MBD3411545.1 tetratricopeptide repeat protein [Elusimicrobiota bacterium]
MNKKTRRNIAVLCLIIGAAVSCAQGPGNLFRAANDQYTKGMFEEAAEIYRELTDERGIVSPEVYYNLGNTYFRLTQYGRAVLWWEKCLTLKPRDADARHNIRLVRSKLFKETEQTSAVDIIHGWLTNTISLNEISIAVLFLYCLSSGIMVLFILRKKALFLKFGIIGLLLLLVTGIWAYILYDYHIQTRRAIVTAASIEVHSGPDESTSVAFTVSQAREAVLLRESGDWQEIGIPEKGLKGWVQKGTVAGI